jgi:hypothetical protein
MCFPVLPSDWLVQHKEYYNQARILSNTNFDTVTQLPGVPASAPGDFNGGRTYPWSGVGVPLPQKAPYNDPLQILICGGATTSNDGLDTCVSIAPEVPNAQWVVERMPSKRVMACMVSLPDGTFLIANGAHVGVSGFASASSPNMVAVLYDPSLPVGQRMRELASTPIARLYHSELILLPDGSVLVSGSDPRDQNFPQEYRHEKFSPPYLSLPGNRPVFQLLNNQWNYGQNYAINLQFKSAKLRVSLVAGASSTHGNTMGSRTLFPAFNCNGNTCQITAPPNANICPPGWYLLFVLDGPKPSIGTWVRIGGDPAQLGNWPPGPAFNRPGV